MQKQNKQTIKTRLIAEFKNLYNPTIVKESLEFPNLYTLEIEDRLTRPINTFIDYVIDQTIEEIESRLPKEVRSIQNETCGVGSCEVCAYNDGRNDGFNACVKEVTKLLKEIKGE